jgi:hypothetical protein
MKFFKWKEGRQGTGYKVLTLINSERFEFDLHVLKYETGTSIPKHKDPAKPGYEHHRLNIVLKQAERGGEFVLGPLYSSARINKFRPDITPHAVCLIEKGTRYVLSIGWLKKGEIN